MSLFFDILLAAPKLYLDPGSGSFLIQLLIATLLGAGVAIRMYWAKIKTLFKGKNAEPTQPAETEEKDEE